MYSVRRLCDMRFGKIGCSENIVVLKFQQVDNCWRPGNSVRLYLPALSPTWQITSERPRNDYHAAAERYENLTKASGTGEIAKITKAVHEWWPATATVTGLTDRTVTVAGTLLHGIRFDRNLRSKFWLFKIDLKFWSHHFWSGMISCARRFWHTGLCKINLDKNRVPGVSLLYKKCQKSSFSGEQENTQNF